MAGSAASGHPADLPGPLVFVEDLEHPELSESDRHHLDRVLRVRAGEPLIVGDGRGRWRPAVMATELEATGPIEWAERPMPELTIGFALVKGDKPELIVQKLTELGIDRIVPFRAERSVVRWDDDKARKAVERLRTVARAAAMQSHRAHLPVVGELADLDDLVEGGGVAITDRGGETPSLAHPTLLVGPEGGWAPEERQRAAARVAVGTEVLRAETAAIAAGALLTGLRAGIVASPGQTAT